MEPILRINAVGPSHKRNTHFLTFHFLPTRQVIKQKVHDCEK
uniref:Uncharacterized protein n=1 Tax=Anguilla anguilla TaxID=7936 RepID=A0A0E9S8I7_ANGAN